MAQNEFHERLINLTFAFLHADSVGRRYLTADWIRANVAGYSGRTDAAFQRMFARDRDILAKVGVPIETISGVGDDDAPGYRLQKQRYFLPEVSFNLEEATVLALAGDKGLRNELAAFARSGWTKLAAAGASIVSTEPTTAPTVVNNVNDLGVLTASSLDAVLKACRLKQRIQFDYAPHKNATTTRRTMDPWGMVNHHGRWFLVGFDLDRDAIRTFRITRVSNITTLGAATHTIPEQPPLSQLVEESLRSNKVLIDAQFTAAPGAAGELTAQAYKREGHNYWLTNVDRDWFVRTAAAYAPDVVVMKPEDVRDDVIAQLRAALEVHS